MPPGGEGPYAERLREVASVLEGVSEQLAELGMDVLRDALAAREAAAVARSGADDDWGIAGDQGDAQAAKAAASFERQVNRVRSAVERAAAQARRAAGESGVEAEGGDF